MSQEKSSPNVLFITTDQMRGDCMSGAGHPVVETPNLDDLAAQGVRFDKAYTACPSCIAARAGILTGMKPASHGRVGYRDRVEFAYPNTLPGELAKDGYHTQGVGKMHFAPARNLCGFHNVVLHDGFLHTERQAPNNYELVDDYTPWLKSRLGHDADMLMHGVDCNSWIGRPWPYPEDTHPTSWATTQMIDFLRRRDPLKPFFGWLSFVAPHSPLTPPQVYYDQYINQEMPPPPIGDWADTTTRAKRVWASDGILDERALQRARAGYYGLISHIDAQVGRLREWMQDFKVWDETLVIFTSDHGDLMGDHNKFRKSLAYEGSSRIPLIVKTPNSWRHPRGISKDVPVELCDIMPTILDACGVDIPDTVDGMSLIPFTKSEQSDDVKAREYIHGEHGSSHWIVTSTSKYIWYVGSGREQYFDMANDPYELKNLIDSSEHSSTIEKHRQLLINELQDREEGFVVDGKLQPGTKTKDVLNHCLESSRLV